MYKLTFKTKAEVPAELADHVKEVKAEGSEEVTYVVSLEPAARVKEFRDKNLELAKANEQLTAAAKAIEPLLVGDDASIENVVSELTELRALKQKVDDGKIKGAENIEAEIASRTEAMRRAHDDTVKALTTEVSTLKKANAESDAKYKMSIVDRAVMEASGNPDIGVDPRAMPHILNAARGVFTVAEENGRTALKPQDAGGNTMFGEDGASPMSVTEWFKKLKESDPFFFKSSTGGGAQGGDGKDFGGMSAAEFQKLSPMEKLRIANRS